jgi:hypothetical protein
VNDRLIGQNHGIWRVNRDWTQAVFFDPSAVAESGDVFTRIAYNRNGQAVMAARVRWYLPYQSLSVVHAW